MPPKVKPSPPSDIGHEARVFLEEHGIVPHKQTIRSSQWSGAGDPFGFYLTTILALKRAFTESKALTAGSWAHAAAECHNNPQKYTETIAKTIKSMKEVGNALRIPGDHCEAMLEREELYAKMAWAWWTIVSEIPMANGIKIANLFDASSNFHIVDQETTIRVPGSVALEGIETDVTIKPDAIAVNLKAKTFWIIDWKSTGFPPEERLSMCDNEFQCQLYGEVVANLHETGTLSKHVPPLEPYGDFKFGGVLHIAYGKPSIKFGQEDRPYRWVSDGKRKGIWATLEVVNQKFRIKRMGSDRVWSYSSGYSSEEDALAAMHEYTGKKPEKQFEDEPDFNIYIHRCTDWYHATGQYSHLAAERNTSPIVNMSTVTIEHLRQPRIQHEYQSRMRILDDLHRRKPHPELFPKANNPLGMGQTPSKSPYFPFYVCPIEQWPAIILDKQLIQSPRD